MMPDDPFGQYLEETGFEYFQYLNWILPLDNCIDITVGWGACMLAVLLIMILKKVIFNFLINKIMSLAQFFTFLQ